MKGAAEAVQAQREAMGIVEVSEHGEFSAGDVVELKGERGRFIIKSIRVHPEDGTLKWLNIFGGTNGSEQWRSCTEERVKHPRRRVSKRA